MGLTFGGMVRAKPYYVKISACTMDQSGRVNDQLILLQANKKSSDNIILTTLHMS